MEPGRLEHEEARHHVAWADPTRLREALRRAKAEADFVVVSYHGGEEYTYEPLPKTRAFAREILDLGADAVIGHHPHVTQGVAWQGGKPIFYSLGNFLFDARASLPWTRASFVAKLRFQRGSAVRVSVCPVQIDGYEPRPLRALDAPLRRDFERHLRELSDTVGGTGIAEADALGCYALTPPVGERATPLRGRSPVDRGSGPLALHQSRTTPRAD